MVKTKGKGVDLILNSLAEEKLQASVRCLGVGGKFLEIGKFDLANDNPLHLQCLAKDASFHGVMLDYLMSGDSLNLKEISKLLSEGINLGYIKPLNTFVFRGDQISEAFKYMASGKHMGKVVIKLRKEEKDYELERKTFWCHPRFYCDPSMTIVIIGGLGGFGLELADWLVLRNAKKLVLCSRKGVTNGYQSQRIK